MRKFIAAFFVALFALFATATQANVPACYTGSWYQPDKPGTGYVLDVSAAGTVVYWFTFDGNARAWFIAGPSESGENLFAVDSFRNRLTEVPVGSLTIQPGGNNDATVSWSMDYPSEFCSGFSPPQPLCSGVSHVARLTQPIPCN